MPPVIDLLLLAVLIVVAYAVAAKGFFGAVVVLLSVVFSGLAAMNFFAPLAVRLEDLAGAGAAWGRWADVVALLGLFIAGVAVLRWLSNRAVRDEAHGYPFVEEAGRWVIGAVTGYVVAGILLTAWHMAPWRLDFLGFQPERKNLLGIASPDRDWLHFVRHVSTRVLSDARDGVAPDDVAPAEPDVEAAGYRPRRRPGVRDVREGSADESIGRTTIPSRRRAGGLSIFPPGTRFHALRRPDRCALW